MECGSEWSFSITARNGGRRDASFNRLLLGRKLRRILIVSRFEGSLVVRRLDWKIEDLAKLEKFIRDIIDLR